MTSLQQTAMLGGAASAKTASYTLVAADAGTAITMSNASATTITVNTALFAAGDTVQITNIGAGVCTITAGTATVDTSASLALAQYESGTLDFTSTSAAIFIKGAGAAPASGLTLITSNTFSGATSISLNNVFSATYENYFIATRFTSSGSTDQMVQMRLRVAGTDATTAEYVHDGFRGYPSAVAYFGGSLSRFELHNISSVNANNASHAFQLLGPAIANRTGIHSMGNGYTSVTFGTNTVHMSGSHAPSTAYDGLTIFVTTGNIAGTIKVYGYAN